jgi:Tfp pilus assembly protein PilO
MKLAALGSSKLLYIDLAGAAIALAIGAIAYWAAIVPANNSRQALLEQRKSLQDSEKAIQETKAATANLRDQFSQLRAAIAANPVKLGASSGVNSEISHLTELATGLGLKVAEVQPGEATYCRQYGAVPIHITGSGSFGAWTGFTHRLSTDCPDVWVDAFVLNGKPETPGAWADFAVDLVWFVQPQGQVASDKPGAKPGT